MIVGSAERLPVEELQLDDLLPSQAFDFSSIESMKAATAIPAMSGAAGNTIRVLQKRMGLESLRIDDVASDLRVSKRTLQRHLNKQDVNFNGLRDQVRFHYAFNCLLIKKMSIEDTSQFLDFSDRTSFTNAFKRWANEMSPSDFRKAYRSYCKH